MAPTELLPTRRPRMHRTRRGLLLLACALSAFAVAGAVGVAGPPAPASAAPDPTVAPVTTLSADGRSATDGTRTLAVSQAAGLDGAGAAVAVSGNGYNAAKGIYVAMCVIPPLNRQPSPCGGGEDRTGASGSSQWISSNPPAAGVGLAQPYGPGGSFSVRLNLSPIVSPGIDCRQARCAIVTRSDHTRTADRSQDIFVPISFRADAVPTTARPPVTVPGAPPTTAPPTSSPTPTTPAPTITIPPPASTTTTAPAPTTTVAADGLSVSDGARTLRVSAATDLDPDGQTVRVAGTGFDPAHGIYVSLCVQPTVAPDVDASPGPCQSGSPARNRWVSSAPPAYGVGIAQPFGEAGSFDVELELAPLIAEGADCRVVRCSIGTRADDTDPTNRTLELSLPVTFSAVAATGTSALAATTPPAQATSAATPPRSEIAVTAVATQASTGLWPVLVAVVVLGGAGLAAAWVVRRRRAVPEGDA